MSYAGGIHNVTFVCTTCRTSTRSPASNSEHKCVKCGELMEIIGYRIRIPKKTKDAAWKRVIKRFRLREPKPIVSVTTNRK